MGRRRRDAAEITAEMTVEAHAPHPRRMPQGVVRYGVYASVCPHATTYGHGIVGAFVAMFIYSKLFELVDTFWLLIRKSPVIFLHWRAPHPRARRRIARALPARPARLRPAHLPQSAGTTT